MNEDLIDIVTVFFYTFGIFWTIISLGVLFYGIRSLIEHSSRIWKDDGPSNYTTNLNQDILLNHRLLPRDSISVNGLGAKVVGFVYIILSLFMLSPVIWFLLMKK